MAQKTKKRPFAHRNDRETLNELFRKNERSFIESMIWLAQQGHNPNGFIHTEYELSVGIKPTSEVEIIITLK